MQGCKMHTFFDVWIYLALLSCKGIPPFYSRRILLCKSNDWTGINLAKCPLPSMQCTQSDRGKMGKMLEVKGWRFRTPDLTQKLCRIKYTLWNFYQRLASRSGYPYRESLRALYVCIFLWLAKLWKLFELYFGGNFGGAISIWGYPQMEIENLKIFDFFHLFRWKILPGSFQFVHSRKVSFWIIILKSATCFKGMILADS